MECKMENDNPYCNCTYDPCSKKNKCCDCLHYHRENDELPACFFSANQEKTYDRSVNNFIKNRKK